MSKVITVISKHNGREHEYSGTIEELCNDVFGYTLECGHSWNSKIPRYPKTAKSLVKALNASADEMNRWNDSYSVKEA